MRSTHDYADLVNDWLTSARLYGPGPYSHEQTEIKFK
jgi:hypothetical protein